MIPCCSWARSAVVRRRSGIDYPRPPMRTLRPAPAVLGLALGLLLATASAGGQDRPRCAVMPLDGSGTVVVRRSLMRALEDHGGVVVIDEDDVDAVAGGGATPAEVAAATRAELVIRGEVEGRGARRTLRVSALDRTGREVAGAEIRLRTGGPGRRALLDGVADLLGVALGALASAPASRTGAGRGADDAGGGRERAAGDGDGEPRARSSTGPAAAAPAPSPLGVDPRIVTVRVGVVLRTREAEVVLSSGSPRSWRSDPMYAELWAGLEVRPLARSGDAWRGLFLRGEVAVAAGLGSRDERGVSIATEFLRASGDLGYVVPVGDVLELGGALGFGWDAYQLGANVLFPSLEMPYVRPGVRARVRALGESLVVGADVGYRAIVSRSALGEAFGPAGGDSHGFDVGGSISGSIDLGGDAGAIAYGIEASWVGVWHSFAGAGSLGAGERGVEQGFRLLLSAGWAI